MAFAADGDVSARRTSDRGRANEWQSLCASTTTIASATPRKVPIPEVGEFQIGDYIEEEGTVGAMASSRSRWSNCTATVAWSLYPHLGSMGRTLGRCVGDRRRTPRRFGAGEQPRRVRTVSAGDRADRPLRHSAIGGRAVTRSSSSARIGGWPSLLLARPLPVETAQGRERLFRAAIFDLRANW